MAKRVIKKEFVDDYSFDLGYHHSYSIVIFTMGMIFSTVEPLISVFGLCFFYVKYYVDKYNLSFVYNREFEGGGIIKSKVIPFIIFGIILFQLMNIGFYSAKFGKPYLVGGLSLIAIEVMLICIGKGLYDKKKKSVKKKLILSGINVDSDDEKDEPIKSEKTELKIKE